MTCYIVGKQLLNYLNYQPIISLVLLFTKTTFFFKLGPTVVGPQLPKERGFLLSPHKTMICDDVMRISEIHTINLNNFTLRLFYSSS